MAKPAGRRLDRSIEQAKIALQKGRDAEAAELLTSLLKTAPAAADVAHILAIALVRQGKVQEALPHLQTALMHQPQDEQRWLRYADALLQAGQVRQAQGILAQARTRGIVSPILVQLEQVAEQASRRSHLAELEALFQADRHAELEQAARVALQQSEQPRIRHWLALALYQQKRYAEALPHFEQARAALPEDANILNQQAMTLQHLKRHDDAHALFMQLLDLLPGKPGVYVNLGGNLNESGRHEEAREWLEKGLALEPGSRALRINLSVALFELGHYSEARAHIDRLHQEGPPSPATWVTLGRIHAEEGLHDTAVTCYDAALALEPDNARWRVFKGLALLALGQFKDAIANFEQAIELEPDQVEAWGGLAQARKMKPEDAGWYRQAEALAQMTWPPKRSANLQFAMGKYCDDVCDYPRAFAHYQRANEQARIANRHAEFPHAMNQRLVDRLIETYSVQQCCTRHDGASDSTRPLFIVGMPRSGTSLTEQILASHPDVFGAGELYFWGDLAKANEARCIHGRFDAAWIAQTAQACLDNLQARNTTAARVVDKMPGNFDWVGLIHTVFPNARILHTMRNPVDTCLSIYFQNFSAGHGYANRLEDLAQYYRQYHRLMAHWRKALPPENFLELPYEQLLEDQEGWSRRVIEFIGLEWDERCLDFHKTERKVGTASNWQARQPIYKTSKERWRNYEPYIAPLLPLLELYDPERGQIEKA